MKTLVVMPVRIYFAFLGRCLVSSREYAILRNSAIGHVPETAREGNRVEILCDLTDAKLLLNHAFSFYPAAMPHIAVSYDFADSAGKDPHVMASEYRRKLISDTWHFCSNCSQWPAESYISMEALPVKETICNECIVKNQLGECD